jgi:hypothetical protein
MDTGLGEGVGDAMFATRANVVDGSGRGRRGPQQSAERIHEDLHVRVVRLVFAQKGRSVAPLSIGRSVPLRSCTASLKRATCLGLIAWTW